GLDYSYFRGLADHTPIFTSRKIHLGFVYLLAFAVGVTAVAIYGAVGGLVLVPLVAFLASPTMYYETGHSLPNAAAAMLGFMCVFMAMVSYDKGEIRYLAASGIAVALATNFKIDAILLGIAPAIALILLLRELGYAFAIKAAVVSGACFFAALFVTRPSMLAGPIVDFMERKRVLADTAGGLFR